MDLGDGQRRIHVTVEIDDLAVRGLAHAHVVNVLHEAEFGGERGELGAHCGKALAGRVTAGKPARLQRLDMSLDLDLWPELLAHRRFEPVAISCAR